MSDPPSSTQDELPEGGPGLQATGRLDRVAVVAVVFAALSLIPNSWFRGVFSVHAFGPIDFPVILAIVGVLFGFVTVFRYGELQDRVALRLGIAALAVGLVRTLIYPIIGL